MTFGNNTQYGRDAIDGDYVLVLHRYGYSGKYSHVIPAIWYKNKARCVIKYLGNEPVNKLKAICVIPECEIPEEDRNLLKENLKRIKEEENESIKSQTSL